MDVLVVFRESKLHVKKILRGSAHIFYQETGDSPRVFIKGLLRWPLTSSDPNGLLSGKSEKSKRFHDRNARAFYPKIPVNSHKFSGRAKILSEIA